MTALLPLDATLDDVRREIEADPLWSASFPFGRPERRTYQHATATTFKFLGRTVLTVDIPTADYADPGTVDRMRREAIETINSVRA